MTRDFSMVFYKCRKNGTNLRQYMKVYQKGKCVECDTKITMTRMGEDSERVTYFCPACQTNDIKKHGKLKLPTKNSLLGWIQTSPDRLEDEWTCCACTLMNPANQTNCTVCLTPRNNQSKPSTENRPREAVETPGVISSGRKKRSLHSRGLSLETSESKRMKMEALTASSPLAQVEQRRQSMAVAQKSDTSQEEGLCSKIPACRGHGVKCAMRQTFKDNENKGRWFFTCSTTPANKRCNFFQWADEKFPICMGHGKVCALRTVMKQGPNNGRLFFCCPLRKNSCQFFEWAQGFS